MAQGDEVIVGLYCLTGQGGSLDVATSGYTELPGSPIISLGSPAGGMWRKIQGATPDSTVASGAPGTTPFAALGLSGVAYVLRGVDTTTPEDATPTTATGSGSTAPDSPSITTVTANAWNISFVGGRTFDTAVTAPTGYTNQADISINAVDAPATVGIASIEVASPGAEDPAAWGGWVDNRWVAASIAVRPAAAAVVVVFNAESSAAFIRQIKKPQMVAYG